MSQSNVRQFPSHRDPGYSRRKTPRLEVLDTLHGRLVAVDVALRVRDLSAGGFAIESPISFPPGAVHQFRFTTPETGAHILRATAIHCRTSRPKNGLHQYIAGFEFIQDTNGEVAKVVDALLEVAGSVLTFE